MITVASNHVCSSAWPRVWRMVLALTSWDDHAYELIFAELGDCPWCMRNVMNVVIPLYASDYVLRAGSLQKAADAAANEVARELGLVEDLARATQEESETRMTEKLKMLIDVNGLFLNDPNGCHRGQVVEVDEWMADRLVRNGHAQRNWRDEPGRAYVPGD